MANHQPRAQRLRQSRQARSAEREYYSKVLSHDFMNSTPDKAEWKQARKLGIVDEEFKAKYGEDPYELRQARREQDHIKRNKRKNNPDHPHPKRPVYSPEELKRRNVLLSLPEKKPDSMSWDLWKGLLKERKKLFTVSNPPTRGIPDYSRKVVPARKKPKRYQEVYKLDKQELTLGQVQALKHDLDSFWRTITEDGKTNYRKILGIKRISHFD